MSPRLWPARWTSTSGTSPCTARRSAPRILTGPSCLGVCPTAPVTTSEVTAEEESQNVDPVPFYYVPLIVH